MGLYYFVWTGILNDLKDWRTTIDGVVTWTVIRLIFGLKDFINESHHLICLIPQNHGSDINEDWMDNLTSGKTYEVSKTS